jgi:arylsulfatase A-like enzyme
MKNHRMMRITNRIAYALLGVVLFLQCTTEKKSHERPNVLLIFADQLRAGELGVYGGRNISTPHLDRLATEGIVFKNAISMAPICTPFRGTLMSGRYPTHTGILINNVRADPDQQYIAKLFKDNGYKTGYIGKWHLYNPIDGSQFVPPGEHRLGFDHWEAYDYMHTFNEGFYYRDDPTKLLMNNFETDFEIDRTIAYLEAHKGSGIPFLLVVAPHPPHPPFTKENCPEGYWDQIKPPFYWGPNVEMNVTNVEALHGYLALTKNLDDNVGRLMDYMKKSGLDKSTIVVFTSDHGELMGAHGFRGKSRAYTEAANIPMIMRWPGHIPAGLQTDYLHSSIDHLPTLCAMAGVEVSEPVDGVDVSPVWTGTPVERTSVLLANYSAGSRVGKFVTDYEGTLSDPMEWRAVKTERYTYVQYIDGREELFDNVGDPYQLVNLVKDSTLDVAVLEMVRSELEEKLQASHDKLYPGDQYADWYADENNLTLVKTAIFNAN